MLSKLKWKAVRLKGFEAVLTSTQSTLHVGFNDSQPLSFALSMCREYATV